MITIFLYGLIAVSIASAAAYGFVVFAHSSHQLTVLQQNQVRMGAAAAAIRSSLLPMNGDGVLFAPAGSPPTATVPYTQLPPLGIVAATPWGQPYLYCPLSSTGSANRLAASGTATTVTSPTGATYPVTTYPAVQNQNIPYVVASQSSVVANIGVANDNQGYVAFIVSPPPPVGRNPSTVPDCGAITITPGGVAVAGGAVVAVTGGFTYPQRTNFSKGRMELYVGAAATGDSTGRDVGNLTTIDNALALWKSLEPRLTMIYLTANAAGYTTVNDLNAEDGRRTVFNGGADSLAQGENSSLVISPIPGAAAVTLTLTGPVKITSNVTFQSLNVIDGSPSTPALSAITVYKPFTLQQSILALFNANNGISVYNSSFNVIDSSLAGSATYTSIGGVNSSLNFFARNATDTFVDIVLAGSLMNVNFDSAQANTNMGFNGAGGLVAAQLFTFTVSNINIGRNVTVTASAGMPSPLVVLNASKFNVSGYLSHTAANTYNDVQLLAGSTMTIAPPATSAINYVGGIYAQGSKVAMNGVMTLPSGIGSAEATITGTSGYNINGGVNCVRIYRNFVASSQGAIQSGLAAAGAPLAHYLDAQYGLPPLYNYNPVPNQAQLTNVSSAATLITANNSNPYVSYDGLATDNKYYLADTPLNPTTPGPQAQALEAAVRDIVNYGFRPAPVPGWTGIQEFINGGVHIGMNTGTVCN